MYGMGLKWVYLSAPPTCFYIFALQYVVSVSVRSSWLHMIFILQFGTF